MLMRFSMGLHTPSAAQMVFSGHSRSDVHATKAGVTAGVSAGA